MTPLNVRLNMAISTLAQSVQYELLTKMKAYSRSLRIADCEASREHLTVMFFVQKNGPINVDGHVYEIIYLQEINFSFRSN